MFYGAAYYNPVCFQSRGWHRNRGCYHRRCAELMALQSRPQPSIYPVPAMRQPAYEQEVGIIDPPEYSKIKSMGSEGRDLSTSSQEKEVPYARKRYWI